MKINYEDYEKLIYKLAHRYYKTTGIEFDELVSCANLKFIECQKTFDPAMASFSTYLYWQIQGLYLEMSRKNNKWKIQAGKFYNSPIQEEQQGMTNVTPEEYVFFKEIIDKLSDDAKEVISIIFSTPGEMIDMIMNLDQPRGVNKHQIQKYLRKKGWVFTRIWKTFKEISTAL